MARWPQELALRESLDPPAYQRLAAKAASLRACGHSDHVIALEVGVTDKTVAKAIRWFKAGGWTSCSRLAVPARAVAVD